MDITKNYILEQLTPNQVSVITKEYIDVNGEQVLIKNNRLVYCNCNRDRAVLSEFLPINYYNTILTMWGDTSTIEDLQLFQQN